MDEINIDKLKEIEEFQCILDLYNKSKRYLENFDWCKRVIKGWYDFGIYDKLGVFLFNIEPAKENVDNYIWIISGDLPTVYLDKSIKTGIEALTVYCDLMSEWAENVINGRSLEGCYPIPVEHTIENAEILVNRVNFIKENFIKK
jgi:hypothetical protein